MEKSFLFRIFGRKTSLKMEMVMQADISICVMLGHNQMSSQKEYFSICTTYTTVIASR